MNGLKIGDKCKVNTHGYRLISELNGMIGTVVCFDKFIDGTPNVGLDFGVEHELFHDLNSKLKNDTGRSFGFDKVELVSEGDK